MKQPVAQWLKRQFADVPDVRSVNTADAGLIFQTHDADFVVSTWMGSKLYVYILDRAPRIRDLRAALRENARAGIGSLFLAHRALMPSPEAVIRLADWQELLMELHDGFLYTFHVDDPHISVEQAHFTPSNANPDQYRVWYLSDFQIENVNVRKRELQNAMRATVLVGDIASINYKRRMNYERVNQRFHYRTQYTQQIPPGGGRAAGSQSDNRSGAKRDDVLLKYYAMLGVERTATEAEIKAAFRRMAMQVHPDVSALPRHEANRRIKELNEAYDYIKDYHGWN